ncbi:MAG: hypothetical protein KIS66_03645 [Fimbriimonadaceae bacterium]|nr:hypothetical protein [Fimbriimonadaceae bacterium]
MKTLLALLFGSAWLTATAAPPGCDLCSEARHGTFLPISRSPLEAPDATDVLHYRLELEPNFTTQRLRGTCDILVRSLVDGLREFTIRLADTFTISATVDERVAGLDRQDSAKLRLVLGKAYNRGETFAIRVEYEGSTLAGQGFGSVVFTTHGSNKPFFFTLSEPWFAYTWWPAKDVNTDKATFDVAVTTPSTMLAPSNGTLQRAETLSGGRRRFTWSTDYPMAPYLLSVAATDYVSWREFFSHPGGQMPVDFFTLPEEDTPANREGWNQAVAMLGTFGDLFGPYPFLSEKYGIYRFGFGGGMEHQTITGQGGYGESLTAHELAHQWWGDMITCEGWSDIWLNEGFATYAEALWLENKPGAGPDALKNAMLARRPGSVNGTVWIAEPNSVGRIFNGNFSYRKAGWVLHMLRGIVGRQTFLDILAEYRARHEYATANTEEFIQVAEEVAGRPLRYFFEPWLYMVGAPEYRWGWTAKRVDGRLMALVHVDQVQEAGYPTFSMPLGFRLTIAGQKVDRTLWNTVRTQHYALFLPLTPSDAALDPDAWVLATGNTKEAYRPGPPKLTSVLPATGSSSGARVRQVRIGFHTPVQIAPAQVTVVGDRVGSVHFQLARAGDATVVLNFLRTLPPDRYTVRVLDSVTAQDSGQRLDGEMGTLPSGDGVPGGAATWTFTTTGPDRGR